MFDEGFESDISASAGVPGAAYPVNSNLHTGIDIVGVRGITEISGENAYSPFSGQVRVARENSSRIFVDAAAWIASRGEHPSDSYAYLQHHNGRVDAAGSPVYAFDDTPRGGTVTIEHGFNMGDSFLSMGFYSRSNHFGSVTVSPNDFVTSQALGTIGSTGASTGAHWDYNIYTHQSETPNNFIAQLYDLDMVGHRRDWGHTYFDPENIYDQFR